MAAKKAMVHRRRFLKIYSLKFCDIWQNFYFYRILNNENFKMEVEQTNFVTHLIITVQLYYWLSKKPSVKIWSNKFQTVMINCSKLCTSLQENLMIEFCTNWAKVKFYVVRRLCSIVHFAIETTKTSHFTCQSKSFISIFFTCQASACELQPFSCPDLANDIYAQTAKTVFSHLDECSFLHP